MSTVRWKGGKGWFGGRNRLQGAMSLIGCARQRPSGRAEGQFGGTGEALSVEGGGGVISLNSSGLQALPLS